MNREQQYEVWKRRRSVIDLNPGFADAVMRRIHSLEERNAHGSLVVLRIVDWVAAHRLAQAAAIALTMILALAEGTFLLRVGIG